MFVQIWQKDGQIREGGELKVGMILVGLVILLRISLILVFFSDLNNGDFKSLFMVIIIMGLVFQNYSRYIWGYNVFELYYLRRNDYSDFFYVLFMVLIRSCVYCFIKGEVRSQLYEMRIVQM